MKKKILFLTPQLPYPPISGGTIKTYKLLEYLSREHELTLACLLKNDDAAQLEAYRQHSGLKNIISEPLEVPRTAMNLVRSNLRLIPLNLYRNRSASFRKKLENEWSRYDIIFADHYVMYQYVPENCQAKIILHQHNCEYLIWERYAEIEKNLPKKLALLNQAWHIRRYEKKICEQADVILAAPNDIDELVAIGADRKKCFLTYHLGDDSLLALPGLHFDNTEKALLYVGTLSWEANIHGLLWFHENVWPIVTQQHPGIKLYIVGKNPDPRLQAMAATDERIVLTGYIEDLEPYFNRARLFISPLRFGSGIKVKVISSLYRGIPCVTTSIGAEGLHLTDGHEIFIRDTPETYAEAIGILLENKQAWESMSAAARQVGAERLSWNAVFRHLDAAIAAATDYTSR